MITVIVSGQNLVVEIDDAPAYRPEIGDYFFCPDILNTHGVSKFKWHGGLSDLRLMSLGLVFRDAKSAIEGGKALELIVNNVRAVGLM